ncbi:MAG: wax ester/triacylglycerol synthase domain-containing protein, partial [Acidimicrobiales bacterium]
LNVARPVWVDDPHFSLDFHVRHTALPKRREGDALADLVSRLLSQRLDRGKPLWELWMVSGLKDKHWALVSKVHYAMIDGVSGADLFGLLLDDASARGALVDFDPGPLPSAADLVPGAIADTIFNPIAQLQAAGDMIAAPWRVARSAARAVRPTGRTFGASTGPHRRWQRLQLPLDDARQIRQLHGCTTTDVILAAITGGIRHYLLELGEPVPDQLSTLVPFAVASEATGFAHGVTALRALLPVGTDDPIARLDTITAQTRLGARTEGAIAGEALRRQDHFSAPTVMAMGVRSAILEARDVHLVDAVAINIPGPADTQSVLGRELLKAYPVIPLAAQVRIAVAVLSYRDDLSFGVTGDWDTAPALHILTEGIRAAVNDLLD